MKYKFQILFYIQSYMNPAIRPYPNPYTKDQILSDIAKYTSSEENHHIWQKIIGFSKEHCTDQYPVKILSQDYLNKYLKLQDVSRHCLHRYIKKCPHFLANIFDMIRDKYYSVEEGILNNNFEGMIRNKYNRRGILINQEVQERLAICIEAISIHLVQIIENVYLIPDYKFEYKRRVGNLFYRLHALRFTQHQKEQLLQKRLVTVLQECLIPRNMCSYEELLLRKQPQEQEMSQMKNEEKENDNRVIRCMLYGLVERKYLDLKQWLGQIIEWKKQKSFELSLAELNLQKYFFSYNPEIQLDKISQREKWRIQAIIQNKIEVQRVILGLPPTIKPRSSHDLLSYLNYEFIPTYLLNIMTPSSWKGVIVSQFVNVYLNINRFPFIIVSFEQFPSSFNIQKFNITKFEDITNLQRTELFGKAKVQRHQIAVVPAGKPHIIYYPERQSQLGAFVEWHILPKTKYHFNKFLQLRKPAQKKRGQFPIYIMLLSFISHEYDSQPHLSSVIQDYLKNVFVDEEEDLKKLTNKYQSLKAIPKKLKRFNCEKCEQQIINFYCTLYINRVYCLKCGLDHEQGKTQISLNYVQKSQEIKFPFLLAELYSQERKIWHKDHVFENRCCRGYFIGDIKKQNCFSKMKQIQALKAQAIREKWMERRISKMGAISPFSLLVQIAEIKPKSENIKQILKKQIQFYGDTLNDYEQQMLKRRITPLYSEDNMTMSIIWATLYKQGIEL